MQKRTQSNRSKIDEKFCLNLKKNPAKSWSEGTKIKVWRSSGQLLGASWLQEASQTLPGSILDTSGEALGPILVDFGASWGRLGPSWELLGVSWAVLARLGSDWEASC